MKMTCFRYGFERYPLSLPKFNLDDRRGVFAIIYPHKFPQSVYFCWQAQHLRNIRSQRVSFETVLKTRHFHRQVRCFRVFQDPQKARRETNFCRQALCFSSFYLLCCSCRGSLLSTGAVVSAHFVTRFFLRLSKILVNRKLAIAYYCKPRVFSCLVVCSGRRGDQIHEYGTFRGHRGGVSAGRFWGCNTCTCKFPALFPRLFS